MTVPRELALRAIDGRLTLVSRPVPELASLRRAVAYRAAGPVLPQGTTMLPVAGGAAAAVELEASFEARDALSFGLQVRIGGDQRTEVGYDVVRGEVYLDRSRSGHMVADPAFTGRASAPLPALGGLVTLRLLVDGCSVEVFAGDGVVSITEQVFPSRGSDGIALFCRGGRAGLRSLSVWPLASIWR